LGGKSPRKAFADMKQVFQQHHQSEKMKCGKNCRCCKRCWCGNVDNNLGLLEVAKLALTVKERVQRTGKGPEENWWRASSKDAVSINSQSD